MDLLETGLQGVVLLTPRRIGDDRGWFSETWNKRTLAEVGITTEFVQDNHSMSSPAGTLRGLHYQSPPHAQDKLVRCSKGVIFDVAVDARVGSPTFGHWTGRELSAETGAQLFVPKGFLHGFVTRTPEAEVQYKCSALYEPHADGAVLWNSVGIDWGLEDDPVLSGKDSTATAFADWASPFTWEGLS